MSQNKTFYYFIENEFICRPNLNLQEELIEYQNYSSYAITVNLVQFSSVHDMKVHKIYSNFSEIGLQADDMDKFYKQIGEYVISNFIGDDQNKIFLGCVRDDNGSHENLTFQNLGFHNRTDPIHDIFNVLKNIYLKNDITYVDNENNLQSSFSLNSLTSFIAQLQYSEQITDNALPIVGYFDPKRLTAKESSRRIWIPNMDFKLEAFIEPLKYLFSINYYEKLHDVVGNGDENLETKYLLNFIILLKKLLNFQNEVVDDRNIGDYQQFLTDLSKYEFDNNYKRCLKSLRRSIETNIEFYNDHKTSFKPIWFSTQMIEAEKGLLRYQSFNTKPTVAECVNWFKKSCNGGVDEVGYSEFKKCDLKFDSRPSQTYLMSAEGIDALCRDMENLEVD